MERELNKKKRLKAEHRMKTMAVLTSGGDAPGMNPAIRAVVRMGTGQGWKVFGIRHGYEGLINNDIVKLGPRDVGGLIDAGGTFLHSARCPEFKTREGQLKGMDTLKKNDIDVLLVIGGGGSQSGANALSRLGFPIVGIASTIDNDLYGSDITIGVDTALNVALESIDRIRTTALSHDRVFVVEVMGRDCGYLALMSGIAGGAEFIIIPEVASNPEAIAEEIRAVYKRGKSHAIVVVAEGAECNAEALARHFREHHKRLGIEIRVTILGHVQRGGRPSAFDRLLGSRLGAAAVECCRNAEYGVLVGLIKDEIVTTPLEEVVAKKKPLDPLLLEMAKRLAE